MHEEEGPSRLKSGGMVVQTFFGGQSGIALRIERFQGNSGFETAKPTCAKPIIMAPSDCLLTITHDAAEDSEIH